MAISDSRKRANAKWDRENMTTLGCKIRREQADKFKAHCIAQGKTSNTAIKDFVLSCIGELETAGSPPPSGSEVLTLAALQEAQAAAAATGETVPVFLARAVSTQAQRDTSSLRLGVNPAGGSK